MSFNSFTRFDSIGVFGKLVEFCLNDGLADLIKS